MSNLRELNISGQDFLLPPDYLTAAAQIIRVLFNQNKLRAISCQDISDAAQTLFELADKEFSKQGDING